MNCECTQPMVTDGARENSFRRFTRRHGRRWLLVACSLLVITAFVLLSMATRLTPHVRDEAVTALNSRFKSTVELVSLQVSAFPRPEVSGDGLSLRHNGRSDVAPLIKIGSFSATAGLFGLMARLSASGSSNSIGCDQHSAGRIARWRFSRRGARSQRVGSGLRTGAIGTASAGDRRDRVARGSPRDRAARS